MPPSLSAFFEAARKTVETVLDHYLANPTIPSPLLEAMQTSVKNGGKRLRPLLAIACADLFNVSRDQAARVGAAIELVHCYSLIHDDLPAMDNADMRRGHPACWREFGEATAILAGDSLLPLAFEILAHEATHPSPDIRLSLIQQLAQDAGATGMAGGQMMDLSAHLIHSPETAITMQNLKTGCLIAFSCESGAILGNAALEDREKLRRFGFLLGLAYQIRDDLLDIEGNANHLGKPVGMDGGKHSLTTLVGIEESRSRLLTLQQEMHQLVASYEQPLFDEITRWATTRQA